MITRKAFSLSEVLLVIVIIGILTTISVISYNGYKEKSENAATIDSVGAFRKAADYYFNDHGYYPRNPTDPSLDWEVCISKINDCIKYKEIPVISDNRVFLEEMDKYGGVINGSLSVAEGQAQGVLYRSEAGSYNRETRPYTAMIMYWLNGDGVDCGFDVSNDSATHPRPSDKEYTWTDGKITACWLRF